MLTVSPFKFYEKNHGEVFEMQIIMNPVPHVGQEKR